MKTFLGEDIPEGTMGLVYACKYNTENKTIKVLTQYFFDTPHLALQFYSEFKNPESLLAMGNTVEKFEVELTSIHRNLNNPGWVKELEEYL